MQARILIVDDELDGINPFVQILEQKGYDTIIAEDDIEAAYYLAESQPDLVVLDVKFGHEERKGLDILKAIRKKDKAIPIIIFTVLDDDRLDPLSYDLDADHFVSKFTSTETLLALVKRCLRRNKPELEVIGDYIEIDRGNRSVRKKQDDEWQGVHLQPKEYEVLEELVSHVGRVIPREVLYDKFFSDATDPASALNRCISELRRKLEPDSGTHQYILTKRDIGYWFKDYR